VPGDRRTDKDIRREITTEREQLAAALADLHEGIDAKRRFAAVVGGALAAGLAVVAAFKVVRRLRSE
jgi:hypothetical protein